MAPFMPRGSHHAPPMAKHGVGEAKASSPSRYLWSVPYSMVIFLTKADEVWGMGSQMCSWGKFKFVMHMEQPNEHTHTWKLEKDWDCNVKSGVLNQGTGGDSLKERV